MSTAKYTLPEKPSNLKTWLSVLLFIVIIFASGVFTKFSLTEVVKNMKNGNEILVQMFWPPNWKYLSRVFQPMLETIQMSFVGSIFGSFLAVPVAILASRNIVKNIAVGGSVRFILGLFRTIPALVFAAILVSVFGFGTFGGMISLVLFTFGLVAKLLFEAIEGIDEGPVEALQSSGASMLSILRYAVLPQVLPQFFSYLLYSFEINIRSAAILGFVGAGGIGDYIDRNLAFFRYANVGTIVLLTFVVVFIIDMISTKMREHLV